LIFLSVALFFIYYERRKNTILQALIKKNNSEKFKKIQYTLLKKILKLSGYNKINP